jgi:hypothetical protein
LRLRVIALARQLCDQRIAEISNVETLSAPGFAGIAAFDRVLRLSQAATQRPQQSLASAITPREPWDCHVMSFARRNARSILARGVFCIFFMNARTTTTRRPIAVT